MKGWFWIDIFSSFPYEDFSVLFGGDDTDAFAAIAPMLRFLKIFRLLKLLRMAKLRKIFIDLEEYIASSFVSKAAYFIKLALFVYYIIHWLSCVLVYLGLQIVITDVNWLDNLDIIY